MSDLGVGVPAEERDPRAIFRTFVDHWHLFLGTPSREWLEYTLYVTLGLERPLAPNTADYAYDHIAAKLSEPTFRPRALFERFNIEILATTDPAHDELEHHQTISNSGWKGRIIPTFRPDSVLDPGHPNHRQDVIKLGNLTNEDVHAYPGFLNALRKQRKFFKDLGATATDHAIETIKTCWLGEGEILHLHKGAVDGSLSQQEKDIYYAHMLVEMAQMSVEDGLVMQLHAGSKRNTNQLIFDTLGADKGADIPIATDWVNGLSTLLNRVGNSPELRLLLFTLDETTYARELAPMVGHWPCLRIGPPWWFHDSLNGMQRYFDQVVETAGYFNLAGFNDDTRAFLSIPARHHTWRRAACLHLAAQVDRGLMSDDDAATIAPLLCRDLALEAYRLNDD